MLRWCDLDTPNGSVNLIIGGAFLKLREEVRSIWMATEDAGGVKPPEAKRGREVLAQTFELAAELKVRRRNICQNKRPGEARRVERTKKGGDSEGDKKDEVAKQAGLFWE